MPLLDFFPMLTTPGVAGVSLHPAVIKSHAWLLIDEPAARKALIAAAFLFTSARLCRWNA